MDFQDIIGKIQKVAKSSLVDFRKSHILHVCMLLGIDYNTWQANSSLRQGWQGHVEFEALVRCFIVR